VKLRDNDLEVGTDDSLVMIASLQADTIDYKKVVIEGNESEAVAVPAFEGQSHWQYWCGGWRCCGFGRSLFEWLT